MLQIGDLKELINHYCLIKLFFLQNTNRQNYNSECNQEFVIFY